MAKQDLLASLFSIRYISILARTSAGPYDRTPGTNVIEVVEVAHVVVPAAVAFADADGEVAAVAFDFDGGGEHFVKFCDGKDRSDTSCGVRQAKK